MEGAPHQDLFSYHMPRCLAIQVDMYNKKYKTNYNYLIPIIYMENSINLIKYVDIL